MAIRRLLDSLVKCFSGARSGSHVEIGVERNHVYVGGRQGVDRSPGYLQESYCSAKRMFMYVFQCPGSAITKICKPLQLSDLRYSTHYANQDVRSTITLVSESEYLRISSSTRLLSRLANSFTQETTTYPCVPDGHYAL
jgi:hypothetical protein